MSWLSDRWDDIRNIEDSVKSNLSNLDDTLRENPILAAGIPFTPQNQAALLAGGTLVGGGALLGGLGGAGAGAAAGTGAAATGGGMSLGTLGLGLGSIGASLYGANQAKKGMNAQIEAGNYAAQLEKESADKQLALQREIWEKQQADYKPYLEQGTYGINTLGALMRPNADTSAILKNDPSYQFRLKQGQQALDRSSAARGMGYSGAQMKAAQDYGQGMASTEFGNYYNRLAGLSQGGQQAAGSMANAGSQYASNAGNTFANLSNAQTGILGQQANARASGYAANANALTGGLNSLTNLYGMSKYGGGNKNSLSSWLNSDM